MFLRTFSVILFCLACLACSQKEPLERSPLEAAEKKWQAQGKSNYTLHIDIAGDKVESGAFVAQIKQKKVVSVERNGQAVKNLDEFYSVKGLFKFLYDEIDLGRSPARYFNAPADSQVHQYMLLDKELGYRLR